MSYSTNTEHHQYKTEEISHVDEEKENTTIIVFT